MLEINVKDKQMKIVVDGDSRELTMEMLMAVRASYTALKQVDEEMADEFVRVLRYDMDGIISAPINEIEIHKVNKVQ